MRDFVFGTAYKQTLLLPCHMLLHTTTMNALYLLAVKNRERIITTCKILYAILLLVSLIGSISLYKRDGYAQQFLTFGITAGQISLVLYVITLIPGVARRLQFQHKLISLIMIFRRYLGILMYLFVFIHMWFLFGLTVFKSGVMPPNLALYEWMGILSHAIVLILALTSNDVATKKLGVWWGRIHSLTYVAVGLIFLHVYLQSISVWSVLAGIALGLVILSHVMAYLRQHAAKTPPPLTPETMPSVPPSVPPVSTSSPSKPSESTPPPVPSTTTLVESPELLPEHTQDRR